MKIDLIAVPYDLGQERVGMGLGPLRYLEAGAERVLSARGFEVRIETVERKGPFEDRLSAIADVNIRLAECISGAATSGAFPLILGGNCDSCLGILAGLDSSQLGIVWFDAHGDFNTPETAPGGYLGATPLAIATGHCYKDLWTRIGNSAPIPESRVLMVGVRDLDAEERPRLETSAIHVVGADRVNEVGLVPSLLAPLAELESQVHEVYLHLDIDVLEPQEAPGVDFRAPGKFSAEDVAQAIRIITQRFHVKATNLTAYNPTKDEGDKTLRLGLHLLEVVADAVADARAAMKVRKGIVT